MKAITCQRPHHFAMTDMPMPDRAEGAALVRIRRIGICGTDLHAYRGNQPFFSYPRILGHELAGEIVEIGDNDSELRQGQPVTIIPYLECGECIACRSGKTNCCAKLSVLGVHEDGGMREFLAVPADHLLNADGLTLDQAAVVECFGIGAHAVQRACIARGEFVLVIGAGPIGLGVMKFAKLAGAKVIALDINAERLRFCESWVPADFTVNANDDALRNVQNITGGDFPTVVFDATGNVKSMEQAVRYTAYGGRLVYVGLVKADITFNDTELHKRELSIIRSRNATRRDLEHVIDTMRDGRIDTGGFITHRVQFDQMIDAYDGWLRPDSGVIKAMVELE
ncbi:zinc-binding alcohol dehydrogenase family protein [Paenibacillus xerothermodurans]|uniref:Alcohol dehydrogenase n=1 Tax=Paenibacillus xerothermodurans TaxID=1977292 RepID=A0A2W1NBN1_PAEXE|nr:zinc-binding alcohol dehydrogenase family protein [Paenibacillus xerothermodurans]PZE21344.1 alcohol dehydrogenase [Paenibacillus xerothermodurans]